VEVVLFDGAAQALELADDVGLRAMNSIGRGRPWTDFHEMANMLVRPFAVKFNSVM